LVHGFKLAFGLSTLEAALASFEVLFQTLFQHLQRDILLCPLRCTCMSTDEEHILFLLTAAQMGSERELEAIARGLVAPQVSVELRKHALKLAFTLRRAGYELPLRSEILPKARPTSSLH
jgi:hypothetical protein